MPNFSYKAINEAGATVAGVIEADSMNMATSILVSRGFIPSKLKEEKAGSKSTLWGNIKRVMSSVKTTDLILFTKQFRSMLRAGVPILRLLQVLKAQTENQTLKQTIDLMEQDIKRGLSLFEAMEKEPKTFSPLYRSMIRAGEISGTVPEVLERLSYILEHEQKVKSDIKSALQYPMIVVIALTVAFFVLLTFVIPKFAMIFAKSNITLPMPTQIALLLHKLLIHYWMFLVGGVVILIIGLRYYFKTENGNYVKATFLLKVPLFGPLFIKAAMSRFAAIFAILQASGVPVMDAMNILSGTIGNAAISRQFEKIRELLREGQGISAPLRAAKYFTPMTVDMVAVGEESGNIDDMLREVTLHYDDEVSYAVKGLSDAIGPILMVGLAAVVGFFALAVFLPMWDLTKMAK